VRSEVERQAARLRAGKRIVQETRHFHEDTGLSTSGRSKEEATDYRYFPEPDLVPVAPDAEWVAALRDALPEAPSVRRKQLTTELGLSELDSAAMVNAGVLDLVLATVAAGAPAAEARNWWLGHLAQAANTRGVDAAELPVTPEQVARVVALVAEGALTAGLAKQVVDGVLGGEGSPDDVVAARGLAVVSDEGALGEAVDAAIAAQPDTADKVRGGKVQAVGALVGAVMKATRGRPTRGRAPPAARAARRQRVAAPLTGVSLRLAAAALPRPLGARRSRGRLLRRAPASGRRDAAAAAAARARRAPARSAPRRTA
jgi:aspartyl-tRNA(Asn)/glutamyl-tRNA(Gln) amidotransferase subunit B